MYGGGGRYIWSLPEAVRHMVRYQKVIEPDKENYKIYHEYFKQYQEIYPVMKEWMHKTSELWCNGKDSGLQPEI